MRKLLTLLVCGALTGCGAAAPLPTFSEISARNSGVPIRQLLAEQRPADALAEPVAVLQTMTEPTSTAKISFAIENGLLLAVDPALGDPILAVQNHDANMIVLRDLGPVYSSAAKRRGVLRRLLEEELQHANDTAIFYRAMPEAFEDSPEEIVVSMMLEAHARASIADAFAQHLASGSVADFHIEPALCDARKLTAFLADDPEQRRAAAQDITLGFMRGRGKFYAAFEQERLGDERFRRALRDEELVRRVFAAAGDIFILADDDRRYVDEADVIAGLRSMIDGPGTQLAQGELFLTKLLPSSSGVSPCPIKVIDEEE